MMKSRKIEKALKCVCVCVCVFAGSAAWPSVCSADNGHQHGSVNTLERPGLADCGHRHRTRQRITGHRRAV